MRHANASYKDLKMKNTDLNIAALQKNRLFKNIDEKTAAEICFDRGFCEKSFLRDDIIYDTKNFERAIGIIKAGRVYVFKQSGEHRTLMNILEPGAAFGAASLFGEVDSYVTTLIAAEDCEILFLQYSLCERLIRTNPDFAVSYISFLSDRIRFLNEKISSYTAPGAGVRLACWLLSDKGGSSDMNMKQLAQSLDIGRASLYRELDALIEAGIIEKNGKAIKVIDRKALSDIINQGKSK